MVNLGKQDDRRARKKRRSFEDSIGMACVVVIVPVVLTIAIVLFAGAYAAKGYTNERNAVTQLANKIDNAYKSDYDIFIDGIQVQSIPVEVLQNYENYEFLFDDLGGNVLIQMKEFDSYYSGRRHRLMYNGKVWIHY